VSEEITVEINERVVVGQPSSMFEHMRLNMHMQHAQAPVRVRTLHCRSRSSRNTAAVQALFSSSSPFVQLHSVTGCATAGWLLALILML
jgi:hypothetical protein